MEFECCMATAAIGGIGEEAAWGVPCWTIGDDICWGCETCEKRAWACWAMLTGIPAVMPAGRGLGCIGWACGVWPMVAAVAACCAWA